jgi:hypothetical protein
LVSAFTSASRSGLISQMCSLSTSAERDSVSARMPPHQPVPITAASTCFTECPWLVGSCCRWAGITTMPTRRPQLLFQAGRPAPNTLAVNCG